jgi:hypothetical protein
MSPSGQGLRSVIEATRRALRRDAMLAVVGVALGAIPLALIVALLVGGLRSWLAPSPGPLIVELCALAIAAAAAFFATRRWVRGIDEPHVAAAAENSLGLAAGSVRGVLELGRNVPAGTSTALFKRAEADVARHVVGNTPMQLSGDTGRAIRRRRTNAFAILGAFCAFTLVVGFAAPKRSRASWAPLLHPVTHLSAPPLAALRVQPGNVEIARGTTLHVRVQAAGRGVIELHWVAAGDVPKTRSVDVVSDLAASDLAAIETKTRYWVSAPDGAVSDTFRVTPVDPLLVSELIVDVIYPGYLGKNPDRYEGDLPPLRVPEGSELRFRGRATRPLSSVTLQRQDASVSRIGFATKGDHFDGAWTPRATAVYTWLVAGSGGTLAADAPAPLDVTVVPDSAPQVEINFPSEDTTISPDLKQPIAASAWDDHGLRGGVLVSWRVSSLGDREAPIEQPVALEGAEDRATIRTELDATERRLLPGDTLHYMIRVFDNAPARHVGASRIYTLRLPSMSELRAQANDQADKLLKDVNSLAQSAKQLQENTRDFQRQSSGSSSAKQSDRATSPGGQKDKAGDSKSKQDPASFEKTEQAKQMVDRQQSMMNKADELKEKIENMERAMQAAGLQDPELQKRMAELRQLYDQMLSQDLKNKLSDMKKSMDNMDPEQMKRELEQLAAQQEQFKKQIDQSLELLKRAAAEQKMNSLAQHAKELSTQEQALADAMKKQEPPKPPQDQKPADQQSKPGDKTQNDKQQDGKQDSKPSEPQKPNPQPKAGQLPLPNPFQKKEGDAGKPGNDKKQGDQSAKQDSAKQGGQPKEGGKDQPKPDSAKQAGQKSGEQKAGDQAKTDSTKQGGQKSAEEQAKDAQQQAKQQAEIARQADSLRQELSQLQKQLSEQGEKKASEQTGKANDQTKDAQQSMKQAQQQAQQKQGQDAAKSGDQASKKMDDAAKTLDQARQQMANQWKQEVQQQVQQAAKEAQQLAQRQQDLMQKMQQQAQKQGQKSGDQKDEQQKQQGAKQSMGQKPQEQQGQGPASQQQKGNQKGQSQSGQQAVGQAQSQGSDKGQNAGGTEGGEMKSEQAALQQGLETLGRNLADASQRSAMVNKDVGSSLGRAMLSMQQTMNAMEQKGSPNRNPSQEAAQTVNALNKLALALANNSQQIQQSQSGTGLQEALQQLAELAKQQGSLNGQSNSLLPLDLTPSAMSAQMQKLAQQQKDIAQKLGTMNSGVKDDLLGKIDNMAKEADELARSLSGSRLSPDVVARQEKLFHRLLDAGRTLEKDEITKERVAERPGTPIPSLAKELDPALMQNGTKFRMPSSEELKQMPPAYRRLILDYFDRLNKSGGTAPATDDGKKDNTR